MGYPTKIATCCYCGTRAALVLRGKGLRELACGSCGAPLHDLKMLRKDRVEDSDTIRESAYRKRKVAEEKREKYRKPRKGKRRKSMFRWLLEEVFDELEDIFD